MPAEWHVGPTITSARLGRLIVSVQAAESPGDQEWSEYLEWLQNGDVPVTESRTLVRSFGGGPNALQREQLTEVVGGKASRPKSVVLTESLVVRGIGLALTWFNMSLRVLAPDEMERAIQYLELDEAEAVYARRLLDEAIERQRQQSRGVGT